MPPRGLRKEDEELDLRPTPWTQEDTDKLHVLLQRLDAKKLEALDEMAQEFLIARYVRKKAARIAIWVLGVPSLIVAFWEPFEKLLILLHLVRK